MNREVDYSIRGMTIDDLPRIIELEHALFSNPWPDYSFAVELESPYSFNWVIESTEHLIGYAVIYIIEDECQVANFAIDSKYQKKGLGTELLKFIFTDAKERGCAYCWLEVRQSNQPAINLYKRFGFTVENIRRNYYSKPNEDALIMTRAF